MVKFDPQQKQHSSALCQNICHWSLWRRRLHLCQIWCKSVYGRLLCKWANPSMGGFCANGQNI